MRSARIARGRAAFLVTRLATALAILAAALHAHAASPSSGAACVELRWELDDTLRDLVELRVARGRAIAPADVQLALRRRGLTVVDPVFRFEPRAEALAPRGEGRGEEQGDERNAVPVHDRVATVPTARAESSSACAAVRSSSEGRASLRVEATVAAFDVDGVSGEVARGAVRGGWRVRAAFADPVDAAASVIVAGLVGVARTFPLEVREGRGELYVPSAPAGDAVVQLVRMTARGPEVVAERWIGDAAAIATARTEADARAPRELARGLAEERAALGLGRLMPSAALDRVARRTLANAVARGALTHRTPEGLVEDRLRDARIACRGAGELLARIPAGADAASRFAASPAHRVILGDPALTHIGAAVQRGPDGLDWIVVVLANLAREGLAPDHAEAVRSGKGARPAPRRP